MTLSHPTRRQFVHSTVLICCVQSTYGLAGEGGDGGGGGNTDIHSTPKTPNKRRKDPELQKRYSQTDFVTLSKREIKVLDSNEGRTSTRGPVVKIDGFRTRMTPYLARMMRHDRASARRLIRDMRRIDTTEKRYQRLRDEEKKIEKRLTKLKAARDRAKAKGHSNAQREAENRILDAKSYLSGVQFWQVLPNEGRR